MINVIFIYYHVYLQYCNNYFYYNKYIYESVNNISFFRVVNIIHEHLIN